MDARAPLYGSLLRGQRQVTEPQILMVRLPANSNDPRFSFRVRALTAALLRGVGRIPLYWCRCYLYGRLMVSTPDVPESMQWVVDFLNSMDLRTHGAAGSVLVRDLLGDRGEAGAWVRERGFVGPTGNLVDELAAVRGLRDAVREALTGTKPLRTTWSAHVELSERGSPFIGPASESVTAWAEAHLLEAFLSPQVSRLRICAAEDCLRAFYDSSRNGRGRWCSTASCGNRMKTRAYRQRHRGQALPEVAGPPRRAVAQRTNRFRREGDYWTIGSPRSAFRLKDSKGLGYLARLLAEPHREFHVLDLVGDGSVAAAASSTEAPILDAEAARRYKGRIRGLEEDIAEAESWNDHARASVAREELSALAAELTRATGLHGRSRSFASDSERARISVTRVIKAALSRIGDHSPELRHHFASTIRTGTYCSYNPDPRLPMRWEL
jgi:hypothetical protein